MPKVVFTSALQRHVACPDSTVPGNNVRQALENVFRARPKARSYVLDDDGSVRHHVAVFVDGAALVDRRELSDEVNESSEIYVMQALSGG
ncbi:MAG: MoaD/ThiS family protein [Polyangiaceae bacterium]|nr:MoaD/ThiS family protein [Polyangiaceae bacterium]